MRATVTSRGLRISYRAEGRGPVLLLLGGLAQWADQWWDHGYGELAEDHRILAVDRLGHGHSDGPAEWQLYDERLLVADLVAVLDDQHVDSAVVWGFSLGAKNAASLAALHPQRVRALVYASGPRLPPTHHDEQSLLALAEQLASSDGVVRFLRELGTSDPTQIDDVLRHNTPSALAAAVRGSASWSPAGAPDLPTLRYIGEHEAQYHAAQIAEAAASGSPVHLIAGADHMGAFRRSRDVMAIVVPFLESHR